MLLKIVGQESESRLAALAFRRTRFPYCDSIYWQQDDVLYLLLEFNYS